MESYQQNWGDELIVSYLDPLLGFAHNPDKHPVLQEIPGFVEYRTSSTEEEITVVALGGSTTDALTGLYLNQPEVDTENPDNWVKSLADLMGSSGINGRVLNGGVAGYSSNQELIKMIRDVLPKRPDVVICLEGVNDAGFFHSCREHPMVHHYQKKVFDKISEGPSYFLLPNTLSMLNRGLQGKRRTIEGVHYGAKVEMRPALQWERNIRLMHACAEEYGVAYLVFLQPLLGYGTYDMNDQERQWLEKKGEGYLEKIQSFYQEASRISRKYPYCIDLTDAFANSREVYLDARHQNAHGIDVLAGAVFDHLVAQGLFEPRREVTLRQE